MDANLPDTVEDIMDSMDSLKEVLEPLLAAPLQETLSSLEALDQAKLQVLLAYVIQDLVFMYLKTRGVDPSSHPVISELARIHEYMLKIKEAEDPAKRSFIVDKDAAKRFITHAINSAKASDPRDATFATQSYGSNPSDQVESTSNEAGAEGEDVDMDDETPPLSKGKVMGTEAVPLAQAGPPSRTKPSRPKMDPFVGYGEDIPSTTSLKAKKTKFSGNVNSSMASSAFDPAPGFRKD